MEYNTFDDIIKVLKSDNNEQSQQAQAQPQSQEQTMVADNEPKWFYAEHNQSQDNAQANQGGVSTTNSNNADSTDAGRQVVNDGRQDLYGALNDRQSFAQYVGDNAKRITMYDDANNNPYSNYSDEELEKDSKMIKFIASTAQPGSPARNRVDRYIEEVNKRNNTKQLAPATKNDDGYYLYNPSSADEEENEFLNLNNEQLQKQAEETKKSLDAMSADSKDYADTYKRFEKILYAIDMRDYSNKNNEHMKRYNQQVKAYNDAMVNQRAKQNSEANTAAKGLQNWLNSHDVSNDINAEAYASTSWRNGAIDTANMSEQEAIVQAWNYVNGDTATADKINYVRGVMSNLEARKKGDKNAQTLVAKMLNEQQDTLQEYRNIRGSDKTESGKNKYIDDAEKQALLTFKQNAEAEEKANEAQAKSEYDASLGNVSYFDDGNEFARMKYASQVLTGVDYAKLAVNAWESIPENKRNAMILTIAEDRGELTEQGINKVADEVSSKFMQDCFNAIKADIPDAMVGTIQNALSNSIVGTLTQGVLRSMNPNAGEVTYQSLIAEKQADWASKNTAGMIGSTVFQMVFDSPLFNVLGKGANIATKTIAKPILNRAVAGRWILPKQFSNSIYNTFAMTKSGQFALGVTQGAFLGAMFSPMQLATQSFATGQTFSIGDYLSTAATGALHFGAMGVTPFISNGMSKWWGNKFSGAGKVSTIFNSAGQVAIHDLISPGINATLVTAIENLGDIYSKGISPDLLTEWARTYGEFLGFHIGGKVTHITRGNLIKNLRSMYGHQTQLSRSVFTDSELKALRGSDAVKEIQRIIRENEQLDDATMNKIAQQHKLIIEDASIPEAVKMKLFAAIGNSAIATPTIADCRIEKDGKHSTVSIYTADGKLFSQERYTSAKAAQNEKKRIDGYIKVNNINMLEGAYNQVWYSAINSDAIESMSKSLGEDANTIVERLDTITRKKQNGERLSEDDNAFVKSFGDFFKDAQKRNENAETDRILNASDVKEAFKKLGKDVDAILSKMPFEWSEAEAEVIDRYTRRMQSDVDRFNSEIKVNNEKREIVNELDGISEQSYNTTDAESMNALAIELNIATAEAEKEFGGATLQEIFDNPVEAIQRINTSIDYTDAQKEKLNELCRLKVRMNAMVRRVNDDINNELEQSRQAIEQVTNKQTDEVIEVELTPKAGVKEGTKVYVINGQLNTYGEGVVDYDKSDKSIAIYIEGEGKKMVSPSQIVRVVSRQSAEEALNAQAQEIVSRHSAEADAKFNATIPAQVGYKFHVILNGEERELEIVEQRDKDGNPIPPKEGNVFVNDNGNVIEMHIDALTNMANELKARRIAEERAKRYPAQEVKEAEKTDTAVKEQEPEPEPKQQESSPKEMEIEHKENAKEHKEEAPKPEPKVNEPEEKEEISSPKYERGEVVLDIDGEDKIGYINGKKGELYEYYVQGEDNFRYATEKELDSIVKEYTADKREVVLDKDIIDALEQLTEQKETDSIEEQSTEQKQEELNEPMPKLQNGEEDWMSVTPERAHSYIFGESGLSESEGKEFISAKTQEANKALINAKSSKMPKVGTSIKRYNDALAKRNERINEAKRILEYWQQVQSIQNKIQREDNERRAKEDALLHDKAVADAQAEYDARKKAEAERKEVGNENPMPAITDKWNNAKKFDGHRDEIILPDGTSLKGHYVLHESGASSPSHNPETWQKTDGFPMDANDNSVNDRDYERDHDAQEHTQRIAQQYDQRALQSVPVVSNDGVVLSGNGRTMAGELAARDNTDGAYINYLKEYAPKFGFSAEQVGAMQHPRVSFVPDEAMPYTAETFAKFNQQEMKSQNKTEQAVKLGKTVSDDIFRRIVRTINGYDTLGDFYNDAEASLGAVYDLHNAGVIPQAQLAEMIDGVRGQEKLSAVGREFLENMLIGKAFDGEPEVLRMLTAEPAMRQTVITALGEIVDNIALGGDWSLQRELADAVNLCFDARKGGAKYGEIVSTYARQGVLFADPDELQTVADFNNATMLMLADAMNDKRVTLLKTTLQLYNNNARESAAGQADLFAGGIKSREDILRDVITFINENYGKQKEIEAARAAAVERRKAESVQQNGDAKAGNGESEKYQLADEQGKDIQPISNEQEADAINPDIEEKQRMQELTEEEKSSMKAIASHLGVDLIFEDNAPYNGVYRSIDDETKKPTIRISRRATNPLDAVFGHEILHRLRKVSSDAYNEMLTAVRVIMGDDAFYNESYSIKRLYAENKENPVAISDKAAGEEVVANFVGSLIHDKAHLSKLVYKLSHPVLSSIRDAFSEFLNYFRRGGLSYDAAIAKGALRMIDRAFADVSTNKFPFEIEEGTRYSLIVDQNEIDRLNKEKVETGYQNIELKDDLSVGSPMASKLKNTGKGKIATGDSQFGRWGVSEENPDLVDENGKITLVKPDGKTVDKVDYNPYFHIRPYLFNKQFKQAWERPKLVFIETEFPASELTSGFKADKAKLTVGRHNWNGGDLILSRWTRPKAIVPWREVAPHWIEEFKDSGVHFDNVPPALLNVLRDNGVKILPPHKGMGANCFEAYESFKKGNYNPEFITDEQIDAFNENIRAKREESEDDVKYSLIRNGKEYRNNGYTQREDGTNISVRANEAEEEGSFSKANFVKRYGIAKKDFDTLGSIGIIEQNEWHHTGAKFSKTDFYSWGDSYRASGDKEYAYNSIPENSFAEIYKSNKEEIGKLVDEYNNNEWGISPESLEGESLFEAYSNDAKGKPLMQLLNLFGYEPSNAAQRANIVHINHLKKTRMERAKKAQSNVEERYTSMIDAEKKALDKWLKKAVNDGKATYITRTTKSIDNFAITKEEVHGRYGWYEPKSYSKGTRHHSGYKFSTKRMFDSYKKRADSIQKLESDRFLESNKALSKVMNEQYGTDYNAPRVEDDAKYQITGKSNSAEKSLIGVHNISEDKLIKAIKQGGFANPSLAVIDTKNGMHSDYGKISLIPKSSLIDSKTGNNAGTFAGDAWTPTYPHVEKQMSENGVSMFYKDIQKVSNNDSINNELSSVWRNYMDGGDPDKLSYWFLQERGIEPENVYINSGYTEEQRNKFAKLTDNGSKRFEDLSEEQRNGIISLMAEKDGVSIEEKLEKYKSFMQRKKEILKRGDAKPFMNAALQKSINEIEQYGVTLSAVIDFMYGMKRALKTDGKLDVNNTLKSSHDKVVSSGLQEEFDKWLIEKEEKYGVKEMLFDGFDWDGNRKYVPNTLENASKMMNREEEKNAGGQSGFGQTRAILLEKMKSLDDIRKNKGKLKGVDEYTDQQYQDASDEMFQVLKVLSDMQKISDNPFSNIDYANLRLQDALTHKDPIEWLNKEYGYEIDKNGDFAKGLTDLIENLENLPVKYFETKFKRPVSLGEFAIAIVPDGTSKYVVDALKKSGIEVRMYDGTEEGRASETMDAILDRDDIRFQLRGTPEQKFSDTDSQSKSREAESMSRRMNVPIRVVDDTEYIFHDNRAEENRRKNSKGYYDALTGEVVVVAPNNETAGDAINTMFHETVAHKGLRDIAGEDYHERFIGMAYGSMSERMRSRINSNAYDAIMDGKYDDWTEAKNSEISKVLNDLSQKDFAEFTEDEIALWKRLREHTMNVIEESSGIADIRSYASLNDTELRYMLWKDNNNVDSSVERDAIDTAMRIEYGLDDDTRYSLNLNPTYKSNRDAVSAIRDEQLPIEDRIAIVKMKLADKQKQSMAIRNDAVKKVAESLDSINRAISAQRLHDKLTASRIVALASEMISGNFLNNMGKNDIKTLLRTTRDAVGTNDFESQLNRLFDVLINNMDKDNESLFNSLISTKAKKVDKRGVEVQGTLDAEGQQMLQALNIAKEQSKDEIEQMITEAQNYISEEENEVLKKDASNKLSGYLLALQYRRDIAPIKAEIEDLETQIKILSQETEKKKKKAAKAAIKAIKGAIRKLKIQRIEAYRNLIGQLSKEFGESVGKAKAFKEMEKQRVQEIHHNANSDMQGRSHASWVEQNDTLVSKVVNNSAFRILFSPLSSFDQMMRMFGRKSANGEGYLWNRYVRGWVECREKELSGFKEKMKILDEKVKELFPGRKGPNSITDMIKWSENLPKSTVEYWNGERFETRKLSQGNLMYIYMANKMIDAKMKLAKMGITDEDVARIKQSLDPKIIQMADWIQEELLPKARVEYNETHKRLFGAPMASIENYFPLKILKTALEQKGEDLDVDNTGAISETTNAFKRRTVNVKPLDIVGTNALNLVVSHLSEMEHINAFGEWNRDLNTLRTYNRFRNQVMNMKSVYGSGEVLWREFNKLCQIAAGTYKPQSAIGGTDSYAVNIAKGYTASRIAFRAFTAAKQLASIIAYLPDVSVSAIAKSAATAYSSFQWSMDNLPLFKERWQTRIAGDPRLLKTEKDWSVWSSKAMELSSKYGMLPNAFVDAVTVAIGAKAIYDTRYKKYYKQYKKSGATDDDAKAMADKKAKQDATIMYNSTQQSNEAIFLSPIQVDRTWHSVMMSIFRNSPFSYTRQTYDAIRNLKRSIFDRGYRKESIEFMTKQLMREQGLELAGVTEEQYNIFRDIAKKNYDSEIRRGLLRVATFGFACSFLWELYSKLPQLTISDDDEQNKEIFRYATTKALFGFNDGLYGGDVQSTALQAFFFGGGTDDALSTIKNSFNKSMPFTQSITDIAKKLCGERQAEGLSDLISLAVATGTGVDVKTIGDMVYAVMDACGDDIELSKEAMIFIMRVTNTPQSQIDQIYFEEVGMTGKEASKLTPEQLAKRYAEYKVKRGTMLIPSGFVSQKLYDSREQYAYQQIKERYSKRENPDIVEKYMELDKRIEEIGKQKTDAVNAVSEGKFDDGIEKLSEFAQSRDYQMYKEFGQFRREFNKLVNFYMKSKSPKEAEYILNAIAGIRKDIATAYNMHNQGNEEMKYNYLQDAEDKFMDFYDEYAQMRPDIVEKSERANAARNALR